MCCHLPEQQQGGKPFLSGLCRLLQDEWGIDPALPGLAGEPTHEPSGFEDPGARHPPDALAMEPATPRASSFGQASQDGRPAAVVAC